MALENRLDLKLSQKLILTPQLQQAIKLLQLSRLELSQTLAQELQENPVLEEVLPDAADDTPEGDGAPGEAMTSMEAGTTAPEHQAETEGEMELKSEFDQVGTRWDEYIDEMSDGRDYGTIEPSEDDRVQDVGPGARRGGRVFRLLMPIRDGRFRGILRQGDPLLRDFLPQPLEDGLGKETASCGCAYCERGVPRLSWYQAILKAADAVTPEETSFWAERSKSKYRWFAEAVESGATCRFWPR